MTTTYDWKLTHLKGSPSDSEWLQTIRIIEYNVHATADDGLEADFNGSVRFESEAGPESIPFDETSEESIIGWLQSVLDINQPYSRLDQDIERQRETIPLIDMALPTT